MPPPCSWPSTPWLRGEKWPFPGQLVEIGGSFRLPEIMAASGAILREVGTTNKTYLKDFEQAITSETASFSSPPQQLPYHGLHP